MARLMRVSPPNSALRVGSSELSSVLEQEVVKMQWCILYELWRKKQSMMVNGKLRAIGKKGRRKRVPFAWRVRMCWARLHCVELRMLMLRQT